MSSELDVPWEELEPIARELHERRLILPLSGRWLSIGVEGEIPPVPQATVFPGGYMTARPRPGHPEDAPWRVPEARQRVESGRFWLL